jgi:CHAT domain-containing protein
MNPRNPMFSRIALAPGGTGLSDDDGSLEVHEVLGLHIRSPLVFLSGCETAAGAAWSGGFGRGEDYSTLAQAFLYAGALTVVATLWRIEDESAAVFADHFYGLLQQMNAPDALADAQRKMLRDPAYRAPYFWAAYQIAGNDARGPESHISALDSVSLR